MLCDEELNFCEKNPGTCENDGKCRSLIAADGNFRCECPSGFKGKNCEILPPSMMMELLTNATAIQNVNSTTTSLDLDNVDITDDDDGDIVGEVDEIKVTEDKKGTTEKSSQTIAPTTTVKPKVEVIDDLDNEA